MFKYAVLWRNDGRTWRGPLLGNSREGFDTVEQAARYLQTQVEDDKPDLEFRLCKRWVGFWDVI